LLTHFGGWRADVWVAQPVEIDHGFFDDQRIEETTFWGGYLSGPLPFIPGLIADSYYLGLSRDNARFARGTADEVRHALGTRLFGKRGALDWNFVQGASMLTPLPGSDAREFGMQRTFANEQERDAFHSSPMFTAWEERAKTLTEGEAVYRQLHGLEAWFRSPREPPPRWKMAVATFLGVFPVAMVLNLTLGPVIRSWPFVLGNAVSPNRQIEK
jgi:hypothetical protein